MTASFWLPYTELWIGRATYLHFIFFIPRQAKSNRQRVMTSLICEAGKCTFTRADTDGTFMRDAGIYVFKFLVILSINFFNCY
jgi:hypothetical protein